MNSTDFYRNIYKNTEFITNSKLEHIMKTKTEPTQ